MIEKQTVTPELLETNFYKIYGNGEKPRIFASPARINIIGEHIDYNGGKVFPAAIDKYLYCAIRKRKDSKIVYNDLFFPGTFCFDINDNLVFDKKKRLCKFSKRNFILYEKARFYF